MDFIPDVIDVFDFIVELTGRVNLSWNELIGIVTQAFGPELGMDGLLFYKRFYTIAAEPTLNIVPKTAPR